MRLFVALEIPAEVRARLAGLISELRVLGPKLKWVRAESFHLTLKFLGEIEAVRLAAVRAALAGVGQREAIALGFEGLGFFPTEHRPRVLWAGIKAPCGLAELARDIERALLSEGFPREERELHPHLTLARMDGGRLPPSLALEIQKQTAREFGATRATEFRLIESKLKSTGAEYTTLQSFPFSQES